MAQESRLVIVIDAKNAERNARNLGNELDSIERKGDFATKSMDGLSVATRELAGYMAGLVTIGAAVAKMDAYTGIQNQLKLVTEGQNQLNTAMDNTFEIAQRSRSSWESTATVYQKLAMNAKDVGLAQEDIGRLTETISKGIALSGATAAQADAAIMQLGQALGSGALRGDEFNSVIKEGTELTDDLKQIRLDALKQEYDQELGFIQLTQEQRLFQVQQSYLHEVDAMRERYRLEREEIKQTYRNKPKERDALLNASARAEDNDYETKRRGAWNNYRQTTADISGTGEYLQLDMENESQRNAIAEARKYNLISEEESKRDLLKIEEDYQRKKLDLNMSYGQQIAGSAADTMKTIMGENSKAYKIMFAAEKAFAIARSVMAIQTGIAEAAANPFPYNLVAMASVAAETASIVGNIKAVADNGFADGGYTGNGLKHTPAGLVHKGEVVWSQDDIKRWGGVGVVESMRTSNPATNVISPQREMNQFQAINSNPSNGATIIEPRVNVYVQEGQTADVTRNDDGSLDVRIRQIAGEVAEKVFLQGIQNPNSRISKAFKQNYNATPRRQ